MVQTTLIPIAQIRANMGQIPDVPKNPRFIRDERYKALQKSIADFPAMLELRELIVFPFDGIYVTIAGNMRYRAMKDAEYKQCPCKVLPEETPAEVLREIAIKDNIPFGNDDAQELANNWNIDELTKWGIELPVWDLKNKEVDVAGMGDEMVIKLKYTEEEYTLVRAQLSKVAATPEMAVWKLLGNE